MKILAMKQILMVLSSHDELLNTESKTGVWIGEFTDPYYKFVDQGYSITLASPRGSRPPIDEMSQLTEHITESNRRFMVDQKAQTAFSNTKKLSEVSANDYDAVFFPGGHGPMFDLAQDEKSGKLILDFIHSSKPVAAVCHGPAALLKAGELEPEILQGKKITGFSNTEEKLAMRMDTIPYTLEDRLKEIGAEYSKHAVPFLSHIEEDGLLITGQNPLSAGPAAEALIKRLESQS